MDIANLMDFFEASPGWSVLLANGVLAVLPFLLPNAAVEKIGRTIGVILSTFLGQKMGKGPGERVEKWFQGTIMAFVNGLMGGLDADD